MGDRGKIEKSGVESHETELTAGDIYEEHAQAKKLDRNFNLLSIASTGAVAGSVWPPLGGSLVIALYNGGPPGVLFEFIAVSVCYWFIAASISELASAIPSSAGVYHFAAITGGPRWGKLTSWYAGWWNFLAWILGASSITVILANTITAMYGLYHPNYVPEAWHVFVVYLIVSWMGCLTVAYANRLLPYVNEVGLVFVVVGGLATIFVCAIMPKTTGNGYASNSAVWLEWSNQTGYTSDGFAFLMGMLNGAYAVGALDIVTHLAEEVPNPRKDVPKAMLAQYAIGFATGLCYLVVIFYACTSLDDVFENGGNFPVSRIYLQATGSSGGAFGLLMIILLNIFCAVIGVYITSSRILWTLARDQAMPFSDFFSRVHPKHRNPFNVIILCGCINTVLGAIYVGSTTAFNALIGSFIILSTSSYVTAILPHILGGRKAVKPGPFWMKGIFGVVVPTVACAYILTFIVIFCFPYAKPFDAGTMNYTCLIFGGLTIFISLWYLWKRSRGYEGPRAKVLELMARE